MLRLINTIFPTSYISFFNNKNYNFYLYKNKKLNLYINYYLFSINKSIFLKINPIVHIFSFYKKTWKKSIFKVINIKLMFFIKNSFNKYLITSVCFYNYFVTNHSILLIKNNKNIIYKNLFSYTYSILNLKLINLLINLLKIIIFNKFFINHNFLFFLIKFNFHFFKKQFQLPQITYFVYSLRSVKNNNLLKFNLNLI